MGLAAPDSEIQIPEGLDLAATIRGAKGSVAIGHQEFWWATRTPEGTAALTLKRTAATTVGVQAWGDGSEWILRQAPRLLGADDDTEGFAPTGKLAELWRTNPFLMARTDRPWDVIVTGILGQKVQTTLARRSRRAIAETFGEPAPGPHPGWILPGPETVAELGYADLHRAGLERKRAETLIRAASEMRRLDDLTSRTPAQVRARLERIRGIGPWTSALVTATALGDADAVPVGDFHIPNTIAWVLAGEERANDTRMLKLLEPYAGHRWRVIRLAKSTGGAPKHGPRLSIIDGGMHRAR